MKLKLNSKVLCIIALVLSGCTKNETDTTGEMLTSLNTPFVKALYSAPLTFDPIKMNFNLSPLEGALAEGKWGCWVACRNWRNERSECRQLDRVTRES